MIRDLDALLEEIARRDPLPFDWGGNDCARYAGACVAAQAGADPLAGLVWVDEASARALLTTLGGLEAAVDARLRRIAPAFAMRGDIAGIADTDLGVTLMVVEGQTLVGPGDRRARRMPRGAMIAAWSALP